MIPSPDTKKLLKKQVAAMELLLDEYGIKADLTDLSQEMVEFTVRGNKSLGQIVMALYQREDVRRVNVLHCESGRGTSRLLQIDFDEKF